MPRMTLAALLLALLALALGAPPAAAQGGRGPDLEANLAVQYIQKHGTMMEKVERQLIECRSELCARVALQKAIWWLKSQPSDNANEVRAQDIVIGALTAIMRGAGAR